MLHKVYIESLKSHTKNMATFVERKPLGYSFKGFPGATIFSSNTIELTVHTSCYWVLDLLCVISTKYEEKKIYVFNVPNIGAF